MNWLRQLICQHTQRQWTTERISENATITTGGCVDCGKALPPPRD